MCYETDSIADGATALKGGCIVAYPTESVFGIGCDPMNLVAVERLRRIKNRPPNKAFLLIAANVGQVSVYADIQAPPSEMQRLVEASWPGPHTWIFPPRDPSFTWITGGQSGIAVRVTAHPVASALCLAFGGAIVSTSANRKGEEPAKDGESVLSIFENDVDMLVRGDVGHSTRPSSIRNALTNEMIRA
jgi:L-threonylcarbamoyladenylate synthase